MLNQPSLTNLLQEESANGDLAGVDRALANGANAKELGSHALELAAKNGQAECVRRLIPVSDPLANHSDALALAAANGHADCVKLLIPVSDPLEERSQALRLSAENGQAECVKLLLPMSDPLARNSIALHLAAQTGQAQCVALLLPCSDPEARGDTVLTAATWARRKGHVDVAIMIEAFIEAQTLAASWPKTVLKPNGGWSL